MATESTLDTTPDGDKERAGIQSVEVGFALLDVLAQAPGPVLAFCRSGTRSTNMWHMGQ